MPKIAHTMAIPPGFSGVSEERYESKKIKQKLTSYQRTCISVYACSRTACQRNFFYARGCD